MKQNLPKIPRRTNSTRKAFDCSTCGKDFDRRFDLGRHERIHSGVRPHVCNYPGCGKQFIQRSTLTVHARVHTGEKPHKCERCAKSFSDLSTLRKHRPIHSGKRPYKCHYADCQKRFTRRTSLTRHQNYHTSTEAAAATAAVLATRTGSNQGGRQVREDVGQYSTNGSPMSTPSLSRQNLSLSPNAEQLVPVNDMHRHPDFPYINNIWLPVQLPGDDNLVDYWTLPTLEPPANPLLSDSITGSPHMGGWHLPSHMPSLTSESNWYMYPDPGLCGNQADMNYMYYPKSNIYSTEPDNYDSKPRMNELWAAAK